MRKDRNQVEQIRIVYTPVVDTIVDTPCGQLKLVFRHQLRGDRIVESGIEQYCALELQFADPGSVVAVFEAHGALQALIAIGVAAPAQVALLRNSRSRRTGPRSSSASVHALRSWHSKLRHPVQHSALDRGFDFLVLDRAGREAYPEYRLVP